MHETYTVWARSSANLPWYRLLQGVDQATATGYAVLVADAGNLETQVTAEIVWG